MLNVALWGLFGSNESEVKVGAKYYMCRMSAWAFTIVVEGSFGKCLIKMHQVLHVLNYCLGTSLPSLVLN